MNLSQLLKGREFVSLASADKQCLPNNAPKLLLKFVKPHIYLIDYSYGRTHDNLKVNPRACLSFMDLENIEGYRIYGTVELIEKGPEFQKLKQELEKKQVQLSTTRVIDAVRTGKKYEHFELEMPDKFTVIKFKIVEITKIGTRGDFFHERDSRKLR